MEDFIAGPAEHLVGTVLTADGRLGRSTNLAVDTVTSAIWQREGTLMSAS